MNSKSPTVSVISVDRNGLRICLKILYGLKQIQVTSMFSFHDQLTLRNASRTSLS